MIQVTELAQSKIIEAMDNYKDPVIGIRALANVTSPFKVDFALAFVPRDGAKDDDVIIEFDKFNIYIETGISRYFEGVTLDYQDSLHGAGFTFINVPRIPKEYKGTLAEKIVQVIDELDNR